MANDRESTRSHESIDHEHPTDAGLMSTVDEAAPATGILGDETLIRDADGQPGAGVYPAARSHTGGVAHPGPTPSDVEDRTGENRGPA